MIKASEKATYCRICEPSCGLIATVEDGRMTKVRGNRDHVLSQGHLCVKAGAMIDVLYDPDRLLSPMKRMGHAGEFTPVSWDEALTDIAARLKAIQRAHGREAVATYLGNPPHGAYATLLTLGGFQAALRVKWKYSIGSEDTASRMVASSLLYGSCASVPKPDLWRSDFVMLLGTDPKVSHSSLYSEPKALKALDEVVARGGAVVVVDPRRTETARLYEHVPVRAGGDAWLLLGMVKTLIEEQLYDAAFVADHVAGFDVFAEALAEISLADCAAHSGIETEEITSLARRLAAAKSCAVYGRTGTCAQVFGTLNNVLQDALMLLTGNLEKEGGGVFGWGAVEFGKFFELLGLTSFNDTPTRVNGHPDVAGLHPSTSLAPDILTPGPEQVRALWLVAGNPVLSSAGGGAALEEALQALDLFVSLDLYVTETNKHADYILPVPTFYERYDVPLTPMGEMLRPAVWTTDAVVERIGDTREEWEIMQEVCARMGLGGAYPAAPLRWLAKLGIKVTPRALMNAAIRTGPVGDWFGLKPSGLNLDKIEAAPNGLSLADHVPVTSLKERLSSGKHQVDLGQAAVLQEIARLQNKDVDALAFRLIGQREMKSINSWLHNAKRLMEKGHRQRAMLHPDDADDLNVSDGDVIEITSAAGVIAVQARLNDDLSPGHVAVPHGWGHAGGWQRANAAHGENVNDLVPSTNADIEQLSGMSALNGVPVSIRKVAA